MFSQRFPHHRTIAVTAGACLLLATGMAAGLLIAGSGPTTPSHSAPVAASPAAEPDHGVEADPGDDESAPAPTFPTNANGQTYGSAGDFDSPDAMPDLTAVEMPDGAVGYVYTGELLLQEGAEVSSPEEALAWNQTVNDMATQTNDEGITYIPVTAYESDGVTEIGTWEGFNAH